MKHIGLAIFAAILFAACTTAPVAIQDSKQAPTDRLLAFQESTARSSSTIVVTRDRGLLGSACYLGISINGVLAARLAPKETATFYLEPGETLLRVGHDPEGRGLCSFNDDFWTVRETNLRANETKHFRLTINGAKADIERSD